MFCAFLLHVLLEYFLFFFFFNDTATTEIYTLSLHDALPISRSRRQERPAWGIWWERCDRLPTIKTNNSDCGFEITGDRKSTRLNSSHANISYAVFCLKKKKKRQQNRSTLYSSSKRNLI